MDYLRGAAEDFIGWLVAAVGGGLLWVVRRVITNQKQIEMLQSEIKNRESMRARDREDLLELKSDVKRLNQTVMEIFKANR
jgi:hypothetical protein